MILYCDTSSIVKLFAEEVGSEQVHRLVVAATGVATSAVAYAEARAALARKHRLGECSAQQYEEILAAFERDWPEYGIVEVSRTLIRMAGDLAERHVLRGFDAVHLASALTLASNVGSPVTFASADYRLLAAAAREGLDPRGS